MERCLAAASITKPHSIRHDSFERAYYYFVRVGYLQKKLNADDEDESESLLGRTSTNASHNRSWVKNETSGGSGRGSNTAVSGAPCYHRRGSLQLWQFLLALLNDPANQAAIVWTGRGMEFKLIEPEEVR